METAMVLVTGYIEAGHLSAVKDAEIYAAFYGAKAAAVFENTTGSFYDCETIFCWGTQRLPIDFPPYDRRRQDPADGAEKLQKVLLLMKRLLIN